MAKFQVFCVRKDNTGAITHYGFMVAKSDAVALLDSGKNTAFELYTEEEEERKAAIKVVPDLEHRRSCHKRGKKFPEPYLRTESNDREGDNLGHLKDCACDCAETDAIGEFVTESRATYES